MGLEYYLFAGFIFILLSLLVFMVVLARRKNITVYMEKIEEMEKNILSHELTLEETLEAFELYVADSEDKLKKHVDRCEEIARLMRNAALNLEEKPHKPEKLKEEEAVKKIDFTIGEDDEELKKLAMNQELDIDDTNSERYVNASSEENIVKDEKMQKNSDESIPPVAEALDKHSDAKKEEKRLQVIELFDAGYSIDEIVKSLSITKGEVRFIVQLHKKEELKI